MYDNLTGLFELRGVHVTEICIQSNATENPINAQTHTEQSEVICKTADDQQRNKSSITNLNANGIPLRSCCALSFYSICFSVIKACSYWNSGTLDFLNMETFFILKFEVQTNSTLQEMTFQQAFRSMMEISGCRLIIYKIE